MGGLMNDLALRWNYFLGGGLSVADKYLSGISCVESLKVYPICFWGFKGTHAVYRERNKEEHEEYKEIQGNNPAKRWS